jgi:hypothetical protein
MSNNPKHHDETEDGARLREIRDRVKITRAEEVLYGDLAPVVRLAGTAVVALNDALTVLRIFHDESVTVDGYTSEDGVSPKSLHTQTLERCRDTLGDVQNLASIAYRQTAASAMTDSSLTEAGYTGHVDGTDAAGNDGDHPIGPITENNVLRAILMFREATGGDPRYLNVHEGRDELVARRAAGTTGLEVRTFSDIDRWSLST